MPVTAPTATASTDPSLLRTGVAHRELKSRIDNIGRALPLPQKLRRLPVSLLYGSWPQSPALQEGYTIVLATPSDLPVFIALAMETLRGQDLTHVREIVVVPDAPDERFTKFCNELTDMYGLSIPIRVQNLASRDLFLWRIARSPVMRHFTQVITGITASKTTYSLLHDADLFLPAGDFLKRQYETARDRRLSIYGVESRRTQSRDNRAIVATWEMMLSVEWARQFPPFMHKGQDAVIEGQLQEFDTAILAQYLTHQDLIDYTRERHFVHFRNVIATWRDYGQNRKLEANWGLKLFLIRTLIDAFDRSGWTYEGLPTHEQLMSGDYGLRDLKSHARVDNYVGEFLDEYDNLLKLDHFPEHTRQTLASRIQGLRSFFGK